jgi:alpha-1,6-mannosyltransferase
VIRNLAFTLFPSLLLLACTFICVSIDRSETSLLFGAYFCMFSAYVILARRELDLKVILLLALAARLITFGYVPNLSDDVFRFIWDGLCSLNGISPFAQLPSELVNSNTAFDPLLYEQLNSQQYFSIYPPLAQACFVLVTYISGGDVWLSSALFRVIFFGSELMLIFFLRELLPGWKWEKVLPWLLLNPLWILESYANLHFELIMLSFLLGAVVLIVRRKWWMSAIFLALSAAAKLLSLLLLPYFVFRLGWKKGSAYALIVLGVNVLFWLALLPNAQMEGAFSSLLLYFQSFEFNASFYYFFRWIGTLIMGWNPIAYIGPTLSMIGAILILWISWKKRNESSAVVYLWLTTIYLLAATTVHPWYILGLILFGTIANKNYPIVWSSLIFLSYFSYDSVPPLESMWLIALEYLTLFAFMLYESGYYRKILRLFKAF